MTDEADDIVDFSQVDALLDAAGREGVMEIMRAFWRSTDDLTARLSRQIDSSDLVEAARTAHAIKGSAANVGASLLASAARTVEAFCKNGDVEAAAGALPTLARSYEIIRTALAARIGAEV